MFNSQDVPPPGFFPPPPVGAPYPPHNPGYPPGSGNYGQGGAPYPPQNPGYPAGTGNYGQGGAPYPPQNPGNQSGDGYYGQGGPAPYPTQNPGYPSASYQSGNENYGQGPPPPTFTSPQGPTISDQAYGRNVEEDDAPKGFGFNDKSIRRGFIKKVYCILMCQILLTFLIILPFVFKQSKAKEFAIKNQLLGLGSLIVAFVILIFLMCVESIRRSSPMNYIVLFAFTTFEGIGVGFIAARYAPTEIAMAFGITALICFSLTCFSFQTKWDFTGMGPYLFVAGIVFLIFSLIAMFFHPGSTFRLVLSGFGVLLSSFYLIYDTQIMIGGGKKYSISPEEYVFAAVNIYTDIITIFIYMLQIVNSCSD